jgi:hypothetical protein
MRSFDHPLTIVQVQHTNCEEEREEEEEERSALRSGIQPAF